MMEELDDQRSIQGIDDYWKVVVRRKWWILGPLFFGWLLVFASAWIISSEVKIGKLRFWLSLLKCRATLVTPATWKSTLADRVQSMEAQVLSRTRLLGLIEKFHLYPSDANSQDDQVKKHARRYQAGLGRDAHQVPESSSELVASRISHPAKDPSVAQKVTIALTSFFVDENVRASQEQSEATTLFLDSQVRSLGQLAAGYRSQGAGFLRRSTKDRCLNNYRATSRSCKGFSRKCRRRRLLANAPCSNKHI